MPSPVMHNPGLSDVGRNFIRSPYTHMTSRLFGMHRFGGYLDATPPGWTEGQLPITPAEAQRLFDEELLRIDDTMTRAANDPGVAALRVQAAMVFRVRCETYFQYLTTAGDFGAMPVTRDGQIASTTAVNPRNLREQAAVIVSHDPTNVPAPGQPGMVTHANVPLPQEDAGGPPYLHSPYLQPVRPMMTPASSRALNITVGHPSSHQPAHVRRQVIQPPPSITVRPPTPPVGVAASAPSDAVPAALSPIAPPTAASSSSTGRKRQRKWYEAELGDVTMPTSSNVTTMASSGVGSGTGSGSSFEKNGRKKRKAAEGGS